MRKISKAPEPEFLRGWKRRNPQKIYHDLGEDPDRIREQVRDACIAEQYFLCAYCCQTIVGNTSHNEHLVPQSDQPRGNALSLEYSNIVASCNSHDHCGVFRGNVPISLTPLMDACERDLQYSMTGQLEELTQEAKQTIDALNLNGRALVAKRKIFVDTLMWTHIGDPGEIALIGQELAHDLARSLQQAENGRLQAFAPMLVSLLRNLYPDPGAT